MPDLIFTMEALAAGRQRALGPQPPQGPYRAPPKRKSTAYQYKPRSSWSREPLAHYGSPAKQQEAIRRFTGDLV